MNNICHACKREWPRRAIEQVTCLDCVDKGHDGKPEGCIACRMISEGASEAEIFKAVNKKLRTRLKQLQAVAHYANNLLQNIYEFDHVTDQEILDTLDMALKRANYSIADHFNNIE